MTAANASKIDQMLEGLMAIGGLPQTTTHQEYLLTLNINEEQAVTNPLNGMEISPLFLDPENGTWAIYAKFPPGTVLPKHFHTGTVHFFTTKGQWNYLEHPEHPQTAGSYLYEPGGSIHTFSVPADAKEAAEGFMVVSGANVNFDENDQYQDVMDAGWIVQAISTLSEATGIKEPRYIRPKRGADFSDTEA